MSSLTEAFVDCYQQLNKDNLNRIEEIYHPDVTFRDPSVHLNGTGEMKRYFEELYQNVEHCQFDVAQQQVFEDSAFITWTMHLKHKKLKEPLDLEGITHLRYRDNKISFHRDYFDLGALVYEHLPLVGKLISCIKRGIVPAALRSKHE